MGLTLSSSKRSRVLENMSGESISLTKEVSDEIIKLIEGPNAHGL
jgi:hypothetical protein